MSWDAISFKTAPTALEYFLQASADAVNRIKEEQLMLIDEAADLCMATIEEKCSEYRTRTQTTEDEFIPDASIYLETMIAGDQDKNRNSRTEKMGKVTLAKYIDQMQGLFATGNLPGAIPPAKIFACHDIVSSVELRSQILNMATYQVV